MRAIDELDVVFVAEPDANGVGGGKVVGGRAASRSAMRASIWGASGAVELRDTLAGRVATAASERHEVETEQVAGDAE